MTLCGRLLWNILSLTFLAMLEGCAQKTLGPCRLVALGALWEKAGLQRGHIITLSERSWSSVGSGEVNACWLSLSAGYSTGLGSHGWAHSGHAGGQATGEGMGFSLAQRPPTNYLTRDLGKPDKEGNTEPHGLFFFFWAPAGLERHSVLLRIRIERILTPPLFISNGLRESQAFSCCC